VVPGLDARQTRPTEITRAETVRDAVASAAEVVVVERDEFSSSEGSEALDVFWRPGCPFCARLFAVLEPAHVTMRLHNIWEDDDARAYVRAHNGGNETVPTVRLGEMVATNPDPATLLTVIREHHPQLVTTDPR
jgi:mycoredoxin